jgi:hypothetical protein
MTKVIFKRKNSWPYSIDEPIDNKEVNLTLPDEIETIEVDESELIEKNGAKYYRMVVGHGHTVNLFVRE